MHHFVAQYNKQIDLISLMLLLLTSCMVVPSDKGVYYGFVQSEKAERTVRGEIHKYHDNNGLLISMESLGGLTGQHYAYIGMTIENEAKASLVTANSIILKSGADSYQAKIACKNAVCTQDIKPGEEGRFAVWWDFDKALVEVLKEPILLVLDLRIDGKTSVIQIPLRRF